MDLGFKSGLKVVKPGDTVRAQVRDQDGINILATTNEGRQAILIDDLPVPIDVNEFFAFDHGGIDTSGVLLFPLPNLRVGQSPPGVQGERQLRRDRRSTRCSSTSPTRQTITRARS